MASINLQKTADYAISESYEVDTEDNEDHTFCGVMFTIRCKTELPVELIQIDSISVRGQLGHLTVWCTPETFMGKNENRDLWQQVYEGDHAGSYDFVKLSFEVPIIVQAGQSIGM
jgi:hypothetical protein